MSIECYLCNGTRDNGCTCHEGVEAVMDMNKDDDWLRRKAASEDKAGSIAAGNPRWTGHMGE